MQQEGIYMHESNDDSEIVNTVKSLSDARLFTILNHGVALERATFIITRLRF